MVSALDIFIKQLISFHGVKYASPQESHYMLLLVEDHNSLKKSIGASVSCFKTSILLLQQLERIAGPDQWKWLQDKYGLVSHIIIYPWFQRYVDLYVILLCGPTIFQLFLITLVLVLCSCLNMPGYQCQSTELAALFCLCLFLFSSTVNFDYISCAPSSYIMYIVQNSLVGVLYLLHSGHSSRARYGQ